jgi:chemotaxis protein CheC
MLDSVHLNQLERDALAELLNMAMGEAAASLNQLTGEEIQLSVPSIEFVPAHEFGEKLSARVDGPVSVVSQNVEGPFSGAAVLIFSEKNSLELVRLILDPDVDLDEMTDTEQDAFVEIGNIIIGASVSTLGNLLGYEVRSSLPKYAKCDVENIVGNSAGAKIGLIMFVSIEFGLPSRNISGFLSFVLNAGSIEQLQSNINGFLERAVG